MANNQRATLSDVAREAGVCRQIAGSVLNGAHGNNSRASVSTKERIRQVAKQLNYKPNIAAMLLRGRRAHLYGLMVASAGDPLRAMLVQRIDIEAAKHGCQLLMGNTVLGNDHSNVTGRFNNHIEEFARRGVDGMIYLVHDWAKTDLQQLLSVHPNTVFYEDPGIADVPCVIPDRGAAVRRSMEYLLQHGNRRVGLATLSRSIKTHIERVEAYYQEAVSLGFSVDPKLIFVAEEHGLRFDGSGSDTSLNMPAELTDRAIDFLVRDGGADAIICHDDFLAADMLRRLRARNISVPNDVAIMGYLDHTLAAFTDPPLTTFEPNYQQSAHHLVSMLENMINDRKHEPDPRRVHIKPLLMERSSS